MSGFRFLFRGANAITERVERWRKTAFGSMVICENFLDGGERISGVSLRIGLGSRKAPRQGEPGDGPENCEHDCQDERGARRVRFP